ncbi:MAG TPA: cell division protein [Massilia sp.]|nr:cell division protein [Massilia sp.]
MLKQLPRTRRVVRRNGKPFAASPLLADALPRWRSRFLQRLLVCGFVVLTARAVWLQCVTGDFLQQQGAYRYARTLTLAGTRGRILDRDGATLAASVPAVSVWAVPNALREAAPDTVDALARLLGMDGAEIRRQASRTRQLVPLKRQVEPETGRQLAALRIRGIGLTEETRRVYPQGEVASQIVGFVGREGNGLEGIELAREDRLPGKPGDRRVIRDRLGNIVEETGTVSPQPGQDVVLSISSALQYTAFKELKAAVETFQAQAGSAIVVDTLTGEILALANYPSYDPNIASERQRAAMRNRALTDSYEPGSVLKPFTVALAIDQGQATPDTLVDTGAGRLVIHGAPISDTSAHGVISVSDVLRYSSNIGTAKLALGMRPRDMWEMFTKLGFGQPPQLGFPGTAAGRLRPYASWRPIEQATMSYGNGIAVSLVQLARAYTVFTNDGKAIALTLDKQTGTPAGTQVIAPATAHAMRRMLENVVTNGTAKGGRIPGYRVGAKTGTAYKAVNGRYVLPRRYVASFVGIVPMSAPRFIVAVVIDEPSGRQHYGGQVAAPVFVGIASKALQVANIAPDAAVEGAMPPAEAGDIED